MNTRKEYEVYFLRMDLLIFLTLITDFQLTEWWKPQQPCVVLFLGDLLVKLMFLVPVHIAIALIVNHVKSRVLFLYCLLFLNLYCIFYCFWSICFCCALNNWYQKHILQSRVFLRDPTAGYSTVMIKKFTGKNSLGLWQIKMKALLKQKQIWSLRRDLEMDWLRGS